MKLLTKQSGTLQELFPEHCLPSRIIPASLLSVGPVHRGDHWGHADLHYICCGPYSHHSLDVDSLTNLKNCYAAIFDGLDEVSVTPHFDRYACCRFHGDLLGSTPPFLLARWCSLGGSIDTSGSDLQPGVIDFFMKQNIKGEWTICVVCSGLGTLVSTPSFKTLLRGTCGSVVHMPF